MKALITFPLILLSIIAGYGQENKLPKPLGKLSTGVSYLTLVDSSRKELFDNDRKKFREMTIKLWYPADKERKPEYFLEDPGKIIAEYGFTEVYRTLKTNSSRDINVSSDKKSYPVLIFSHGWGEHFSQNTILMEELASHGYIVFSIAHHYECKFSFYGDGRFIGIDDKSIRFQEIMNEQMNPAAMEIFRKMFAATNDEDREKIFTESCAIMPTLLNASPKYWAEDIKYLMNELLNINETDRLLKGKLDVDRIGVFGMSMGGIATNEVCISDKRVKAGINIDGGIYGTVLVSDIITPFLFINSQRYAGFGNLFIRKVNNESYSITLKNSDHYNFSDYAFYPVINQSQIGTIDPAIPIKMMNKIIVLFFDKYVKNKKVADIESVMQEFDAEFNSKIK